MAYILRTLSDKISRLRNTSREAKEGVAVSLFIALFQCVCVLRFVIDLCPNLDKAWDYGPFYTHIGDLASLAIWFTLFVANVFLLRKTHNLRGNELALDTEKVVLSFFVISYHVWMIIFVYNKWANQLTVLIRVNIFIIIVAFIIHAIYQMDCIFSNLYAKTDQLVTPLKSKWTGYVSIHFNAAMILHLVTIVITYDEYGWLKDNGLFFPVVLTIVCEVFHRCLAIYVFCKLIIGMKYKHARRISTDSNSSSWLMISCQESEPAQGLVSTFVSQNTIPQIPRGKRTLLVTGYNAPHIKIKQD